MTFIETIDALESYYGTPGATSLDKVAYQLTPAYRKWIFASRFCALSTVGPEGTDCSPRGDDGPVVTELDPKTLAMPDWRGNHRLDSLRNIVADGRVSLMFMVPGSNTVVRLNGRAKLSADEPLRARFERKGALPRTVIVIQIGEIYFQCARAPLRARLWSGVDESAGLPTAGDFLAEATDGALGGKPYDEAWSDRAAASLW